jgi:hypothetical protein
VSLEVNLKEEEINAMRHFVVDTEVVDCGNHVYGLASLPCNSDGVM